MADIVQFLNRQIQVAEKPDTSSQRLRTYIPEVGDLGFTLDPKLTSTCKERLERMAGTFPHDGMTPEEEGALLAMADLSTQVVSSARTYVDASNKIGKDTTTLYDLEQKHKHNFMQHDLKVKQIDARHAGTLQAWQGTTEGIVNDVRQKVAYLKTLQSAM
jgi:hypothetical protein